MGGSSFGKFTTKIDITCSYQLLIGKNNVWLDQKVVISYLQTKMKNSITRFSQTP